MARVPDLVEYCARHGLSMITVADLIAYRRRHDKLVERVVATRLPTTFGDFEAVGYRSLVDDKHHVALVKGEVAGRARRARARALGVPHRRRLPLAALRLRRAARIGAVDDRARGPGRAAVPLPGGPRDRPAEQAARLPPAGGRPRHRRGQRAPRPAGRPARLRHRRPDPRRPRAQLDPDPHQQPEEDQRPGGLRAVGQRPDPDRARAQRAQRGVPAHQGRADGPHAPPPGPEPRRASCCTASAASASAASNERNGRALRDRRRALLRGARRAAGRRRARPPSPRPAHAEVEVLRRPRRLRAAAGRQLRRRAAGASRASPASAR